MSNTRTRPPGTPAAQRGYASSDEYERGLYANLVAQRCSVLESAEDRELLMAIQYYSHQPGGLKRFVHDLIAEPGREELPYMEFARREGHQHLEKICLDPAQELRGPWYWFDLMQAVRGHLVRRAQSIKARMAETAVTREVFAALDYTLTGDGITLIDGLARIGKTWAVKAYCEMRPGRLRYVQVPSTNDDRAFVCSLADAYGSTHGTSLKTAQILESVRKAAHTSKVGVVLDEGHNLLPSDHRCRNRPTRVAWIMNEFVNFGVPVAICVTPQFAIDKARIQQRTGWSWEQFDGRIGYVAPLERILPIEELKAVARVHLPEAAGEAILTVAKYAEASSSYVAGIEHVARRARYEASRAGRDRVTLADIASAIRSRRSLDGPGAPVLSTGRTAITAKPRTTSVQQSNAPRSRLDTAETLLPTC